MGSPIGKKYLPTEGDKRKGGVVERFAKKQRLNLRESGSIAVQSFPAWGAWIEIKKWIYTVSLADVAPRWGSAGPCGGGFDLHGFF